MNNRKIHIVDEGSSYERLTELLSDYSFEISVSTDVENAMEEIKESKAQLVIIDIHIREKFGIHLCERLKVDEETKPLMVVFMTVSGFPYLIAQAYKAGAKDFITKPFSPIETVLRIRSLMDLVAAQIEVDDSRGKEKEALTEAENASKIKSQFLAVMSHEIRTPLNAVIGFSSLLVQERLTEDQLSMINTIKSSSDVLLNLVNDILDITKIESGQVELDSLTFNIEETAYSAAEISRSKMVSDLVEMNLDILVETQFVKGDGFRVKQVLTNLLSNAVKFTSTGEVKMKIRNNGSRFLFSVSDTGIGMSNKQQEMIFTPFVQADSSTTRKFGGTGLGLSISNSFVNAMGGEIKVESELGVGSCFSFEIDLDQEDNGSFAIAKSYNGNVLVLDDNVGFCRTVSRDLKSLGMHVDSYTNWNDIPNNVEPYELAIIDSVDEKYQNCSFIKKLKEKHSIKNCVAVQNRHNPRLSDTLMSAGYDFFVCKPLRINSITKILDKSKSKKTRTGSIIKGIEKTPVSLNILVAEDNSVNQRLIIRMLKDLGHDATIAENGKVALELLEDEDFDLVLMDMQMPIMSGCEATTHIRNKFHKLQLPIIAMTANAMTHHRKDCLAHGMNEFISKPVTKERLYFSLEKYKGNDYEEAVEMIPS